MKNRNVCKLIALILALVMAVGMVGCGAKEGTAAPESPATEAAPAATEAAKEEAAAPAGVTITIATSDDYFTQTDLDIIAEYEAYSGNKVEVQEIPSDQYSNWLQTKLAVGEAPDIILTWPQSGASKFFPDINFMDLTGEPLLERQTESAVRNQTYNNRIIGWGLQGGDFGWGMVYSKAVFEEAGITKAPSNWAEFMDVCDKIAAIGKVPFAGSFKAEWTAGVWMAIMGPRAQEGIDNYYNNLNNGTATFAENEVFKTTLDQMKELYDKGYFGPDAFSHELGDAWGEVLQGNAGMTLCTCFPVGAMSGMGVEINTDTVGMFPAPFADNQTLSAYDGGFIRAINANTKNPEACKDYLNFLSKQENLDRLYQEPIFAAIIPSFEENYKNYVIDPTTQELIDNSNGTSYTIMEVGIDYWDNSAVGKNVIQVILGNMTSEEALADIDAQRARLIEMTS